MLITFPSSVLASPPFPPLLPHPASDPTATTVADGVQRGSTWQCCPGTMVYRRDIAKEVFGTDDPTAVGEKTWSDFMKPVERVLFKLSTIPQRNQNRFTTSKALKN